MVRMRHCLVIVTFIAANLMIEVQGNLPLDICKNLCDQITQQCLTQCLDSQSCTNCNTYLASCKADCDAKHKTRKRRHLSPLPRYNEQYNYKKEWRRFLNI